MSPAERLSTRILLTIFAILVVLPMLRAQETGDLDAYKWRATGAWWFSHPTGSFHASTDLVSFDFNKDFHFGDYSTFSGSLDWHFKRKHHLILLVNPIYSSKTATMTEDITFQGVTYHVGASVSADLNSLSFMPGYQYDIIRRRQGYLGIVAALNLLDTKGSLTGTGTLNNVSATYTSSASVLAPLPIVGPKARWYPMHDSDRFSLDGAFQGMYFFGYGNFIYTHGSAQVKLHKNLSLKAGYQMGTRFTVHGKADQVGLRLTQQGPVAGLEASW
jgi:hypothetical protein